MKEPFWLYFTILLLRHAITVVVSLALVVGLLALSEGKLDNIFMGLFIIASALFFGLGLQDYYIETKRKWLREHEDEQQ